MSDQVQQSSKAGRKASGQDRPSSKPQMAEAHFTHRDASRQHCRPSAGEREPVAQSPKQRAEDPAYFFFGQRGRGGEPWDTVIVRD